MTHELWSEASLSRSGRWPAPPTGICQKCNWRPATTWWGNAMTLNHGGGEKRCDVCVLGPQIAHAWKRTVALPGLILRYLRAWL